MKLMIMNINDFVSLLLPFILCRKTQDWRDVSMIQSLVDSYMSIVSKTVKDIVPINGGTHDSQ